LRGLVIELSFKRLNLSKRDLGRKRVRSVEVEVRPIAVRDCLERAGMSYSTVKYNWLWWAKARSVPSQLKIFCYIVLCNPWLFRIL